MKAFWLLTIFVSIHAYGQDAGQSKMQNIRALLKAGTIKKVEILRVPDSVATRTSLTPELLRSSAHYKVTLSYGFESSLDSLFAETSVQGSSRTSDLRWGVLFYDASGQQLASIFVDHFGETGYINKEAVRFSPNLGKRLRRFVQELP